MVVDVDVVCCSVVCGIVGGCVVVAVVVVDTVHVAANIVDWDAGSGGCLDCGIVACICGCCCGGGSGSHGYNAGAEVVLVFVFVGTPTVVVGYVVWRIYASTNATFQKLTATNYWKFKNA